MQKGNGQGGFQTISGVTPSSGEERQDSSLNHSTNSSSAGTGSLTTSLDPSIQARGLPLPGIPSVSGSAINPDYGKLLAAAQMLGNDAAGSGNNISHALLALTRGDISSLTLPGANSTSNPGVDVLNLLQHLQQLSQLRQKQQLQQELTPQQELATPTPAPVLPQSSRTMDADNTEAKEQKMPVAAKSSVKPKKKARLTAVPASSENKAAGTEVILPCRARGMPVDHNFRNAHFVMPEHVQHGDDLICSYEACRNAGVKFRYCITCRIPVAKRNFNHRHSHGLNLGEGGSSDGKNGSTGVDTEKATVNKNATTNVAPSPQAIFSGKSAGAAQNSEGASQSSDNITLTRKRHWAILLENRPNSSDAEEMTKWLDEVMAISDLKIPLYKKSSESPEIDDQGATTTSSVTTGGNYSSSSDSDSSASSDSSGKNRHRGGEASNTTTKHHGNSEKKQHSNNDQPQRDREGLRKRKRRKKKKQC